MLREAAVQWFERMQAELRGVRRVTSTSRARLAPDFNVISYIRTDENGLSLLLADLLSPKGRHGQGTAFLTSFIQSYWPDAPALLDLAKADVTTESSTYLIENSARRIDIKVVFPGQGILGIENKAWSALDQPKQVSDYLKQLHCEHSDHRLLYLTQRRGQLPTVASITPEELAIVSGKQFKALGFIDLLPWLKSCIAECRSERVRMFLEDFMDYIQTEMQGTQNMIENDVIVNSATASTESVRSYFEVALSIDLVRQSLMAGFAEALKLALAEPENTFFGWVATCETVVAPYGCVYVQPSHDSTLCIALGFGSSGSYNNAMVGIRPRFEKCEPSERDRLRDELRICLGPGDSGDTWPWYRWFPTYRDWGNSVDAMAAVADPGPNGMVALTLKQFEEIREKLENGGCIPLLS